jgi:hypothetical protein
MYELSEPPAAHAPGSAHLPFPGAPAALQCPVCASVERIGATYFERAFGPDSSMKAVAESIADDLGFCERHGRALSTDAMHPMRIAHAFAAAIARIEPLLHESVVDERCQRLFFSAGRRCPACSAEEAAAGRLLAPIRQRWLRTPDDAGEVATLCWHHFQSLAGRLALEPRGQAIQRYLEGVDTAAQALAQRPDAGLARALALLGPHAPGEAVADAQEVDEAPRRMQDLLAAPHACLICEAIGRTRRHWLRGLRWSGEHETAEYLWLFAPCCARHVGDAARLGHAGLLEAVAAFALAGIGEQLRQQLAGIVHELALAQQAKPVWYRPRRRRRDKTASATPAPARRRFVLRCQGCEAEAIALEKASADLLDCLRRPQGRELLARGHGLCLRHLAHLLPIAAPDTVRLFLTDVHLERLQSLRAALVSGRAASAPWREAIYRFRGWPD